MSYSDRKEVLAVYTRWDIEDFDVVAFAYTPIPSSMKFLALGNSSLSSGNLITRPDVAENDCVFIIDPSTYDDLEVKENEDTKNTVGNNNTTTGTEKRVKISQRRSMFNKSIEASIWPHMTQQVFLGRHHHCNRHYYDYHHY